MQSQWMTVSACEEINAIAVGPWPLYRPTSVIVLSTTACESTVYSQWPVRVDECGPCLKIPKLPKLTVCVYSSPSHFCTVFKVICLLDLVWLWGSLTLDIYFWFLVSCASRSALVLAHVPRGLGLNMSCFAYTINLYRPAIKITLPEKCSAASFPGTLSAVL